MVPAARFFKGDFKKIIFPQSPNRIKGKGAVFALLPCDEDCRSCLSMNLWKCVWGGGCGGGWGG